MSYLTLLTSSSSSVSHTHASGVTPQCHIRTCLLRLLLAGLLQNKLAACINVIPGVVSYYEWEGKMEEDSEVRVQ